MRNYITDCDRDQMEIDYLDSKFLCRPEPTSFTAIYSSEERKQKVALALKQIYKNYNSPRLFNMETNNVNT
jgi:hypothetical protein